MGSLELMLLTPIDTGFCQNILTKEMTTQHHLQIIKYLYSLIGFGLTDGSVHWIVPTIAQHLSHSVSARWIQKAYCPLGVRRIFGCVLCPWASLRFHVPSTKKPRR